MRLAVLADIHGNLIALEHVLADARKQGADAIVVLGDLADRGPFPVETLAAVRDAADVVIRGNTDERFLLVDQGDAPEAWYHAAQFGALRWSYERLSRAELDYLAGLPGQHRLEFDGLPPVRLVHGSPRSSSEPVYPDRDTQVADVLGLVEEDVLAMGHTHYSWVVRSGAKVAFNPGSVGQPFNGDPRAQYALLTANGHGWQVEHRALDYDRRPLCDAFSRSGMLGPERGFARAGMLSMLTGRDEILPFLRYAADLAHNNGSAHSALIPDAVWGEASMSYDWRRVERICECIPS